jgi:hypothetical protein
MAKQLLAHPRRRPLARRGDDRELLGIYAAQLGLVAAGLDTQRRRVGRFKVDPLARRQPGDGH